MTLFENWRDPTGNLCSTIFVVEPMNRGECGSDGWPQAEMATEARGILNLSERAFRTEQDLVAKFTAELLSDSDPWEIQAHTFEFDYLRGRVDVIAVSSRGEVVAFEAKLIRWRDALDQAYRNTCFAHRSYVVLPPKAAARAALYFAEFERRGVGICSVGHDCLEVLLEARAAEPLQKVLSQQAVRAVEQAVQ